MREETFEHADRGVERPADRAILDFAVPAAILELLADQALDDALDVLPEIGAETDHHAVDARLDLAFEERLAGILPAAVVADELDRSADAVVVRIHAKFLELHEAVGGGGPRLTVLAVPRERLPVPPGEQRAAFPQAVVTLQREESRAPSLGGYLRPFRLDDLRRRVAQIAQGLPADRWVGLEQPIQRRHAPSLATGPKRPRIVSAMACARPTTECA